MSRLERDEAALEAEIARLPDLGHDELRKRWKLLFGRPAPKSLRRKFMARAVAYQMQVAVYGGLSAATKRRLREIALAISSHDASSYRTRTCSLRSVDLRMSQVRTRPKGADRRPIKSEKAGWLNSELRPPE